jgi:hypothetical protein
MNAFIAVLVTVLTLASSPAFAQSTSQGIDSGSTSSPASGRGSGMDVFCSVMMLGTFCTSTDASGGPGYGAPSGNGLATSPSTPQCVDGTPDNELCN